MSSMKNNKNDSSPQVTTENKDQLQTIFELLAKDLEHLNLESVRKRIHQYLSLIREWNDRIGLVSKADVCDLETKHLADSLSLAAYVQKFCGLKGRYLDIGSGAGFPAIPLAIILPEIDMSLVERSQKRVGFLRMAKGRLGLEQIDIVLGEFPDAVRKVAPSVITARAVEHPTRVIKGIVPFLQSGAVFLSQFKETEHIVPPMFHVEPIEDEWTRAKLRRGKLWLVSL